MSTSPPKAPPRRPPRGEEVDPTTRKVGKRLRLIRQQLHLSLDECADRTGIPAESLGRYERGENSPTVRMLDRIAGGLNVDPMAFFLGEPDANDLGVDEIPDNVREVVATLVGRSPGDVLRAKLLVFALFAEEGRLRDPGKP